jgi:hypothetical protein
MSFRHCPALVIAACVLLGSSTARAQEPAPGIEYKLLATSKTSTMEAEMRQAAGQGFRFAGVMGGETSFGGSEVVVLMTRAGKPVRFDLDKELADAGALGFTFVGLTVSRTAMGGTEVVAILRRETAR